LPSADWSAQAEIWCPPSRRRKLSTSSFKPGIPLFLALGVLLSTAVWVATWRHGVAFSPDSVSYWGAAERLAEEGSLEIPVTGWSEARDYVPISHHAPLLPFVLGVTRRFSGVGVSDLARMANIATLFLTAICMGLATRGGMVSFAVLTAVLVTPSVFELYLALWTEPLFLALCSCTFLLLVRSIESPSKMRLLLLGITCSAAALTRYVGVFLPPAVCMALLLPRPQLRVWLANIAVLVAPFFLLVGGWFVHLSAVGAPARRLDWYPGALSQLASQLPNTVSNWVFPAILLPPAVGAFLILFGGGAIVLRSPKEAGQAMRAHAAAIFFVLYLFAVVFARAFADPSIPFDGRMLSPMVIFLGLAVASASADVRSRSVPGAAIWVAVAVVLAAQAYRIPRYLARGQQGNGYESSRYEGSGWLASIVASDPETTTFTNDPFLLATLTKRPVKAVPLRREKLDLATFVTQVKARSPSVVVLLPDAHDMYIRRQDLIRHLGGIRGDACGEVYLFEFAEGAELPSRSCGRDVPPREQGGPQ
jgi:4-amino-4-deoxy-L-arabinose transferase-like glycosyltransferase